MTNARLGFDVDSSGLKAGKADLDALVPAAKRAETAADGLSKSFGTTATSVKASTTEIQKAVGGLDKTGASMKGAASGANALSEELIQLRNRFNPLYAATERYEQELRDIARAEKLGALAANEAATARQRATASFRSMQSAMGGAGGGLGSLTSQIQNASYQIGDFAVQVGAGTSAAVALGQQLPQLAGGFGIWGAAVGAAVAIAVPLGAALFNIRGESESLEDTMDGLSDAVGELADATEAAQGSTESLIETYGRFADQARVILDLQRELAQEDAVRALKSSSDALADFFEVGATRTRIFGDEAAINTQIKRIQDALDVTKESAFEFATTLAGIELAEGPEATAAAFGKAKDEILEATGGVRNMSDEAYELYRELLKGESAALQIASAADDTTSAIYSAADAVTELTGRLNDAVSAASSIGRAVLSGLQQSQIALATANINREFEGNPILAAGEAAGAEFDIRTGDTTGLDPIVQEALKRQRSAIVEQAKQAAQNEIQAELLTPVDLPTFDETSAGRAAARGSRSRGGGRSGRSDAEREAERQAEAYAKVTEALQHEIDTFALSEVAQNAANEARKAGVDLASEQGQSISALVYELDALESKQRQVEAVNQFVADSFADLFSDAITGAESFGDALSNLLGQLGQMAINQGFQSLLSGVGDTAAGGLFGSIFGFGAKPNANGNAFDRGNVIPFASGGVVDRPTLFPMANGTGLMGEAGQEAIMPLKRGADGKLGVASSGGSSPSITFNIDAKGADATRIAALQAQLAAMQQTLPAQIKSYLADPRMSA